MIVPVLYKMSEAAVLAAYLSLTSESSHFSVKGVLTVDRPVVDHLLKTYATDETTNGQKDFSLSQTVEHVDIEGCI